MFEDIQLMPEQEQLLSILVERARSIPLEKREKFVVSQACDRPDVIFHPALPGQTISGYFGDVEALAKSDLLSLSYGSRGTPRFDITPRGFVYYETLKKGSGEPAKQLESDIRSYLDTETFKNKYAKVHQKWICAQNKLWASDSEVDLTTIGHLCREAMQEFATALVEHYQPPDVDPNKTHDVARVKAVIAHAGDCLGTTQRPFLDALIAYWRTVSDLVQRQEHGGQKEGKPLVWEDARRVVFQTAVVMFEVDQSLQKIAAK